MVEGGVGVLWRTDGHNGELQVIDGLGRDRGNNWGLLPLLVRFADQVSGAGEPKADHYKPQDLG